MSLTVSQITILRTVVLAEPSIAAAVAIGDDQVIADWCNAPSTFIAWKTSTPASEVFDAINWANFTPLDVPDSTVLWSNRSLQCQTKQMAIQTFLIGQSTINSSKNNIRNGLKDALQQIPSGVSGALKDAGWAEAKTAMSRTLTKAESVLATGTGTAANPGNIVFEGLIDLNTASLLR